MPPPRKKTPQFGELYDATGHPLAQGGIRKVGPERKCYQNPWKLLLQNKKLLEQGDAKTTTAATSLPMHTNYYPINARTEKEKTKGFGLRSMDLDWYTSNLQAIPGPYQYTKERGHQMAMEMQFMANPSLQVECMSPPRNARNIPTTTTTNPAGSSMAALLHPGVTVDDSVPSSSISNGLSFPPCSHKKETPPLQAQSVVASPISGSPAEFLVPQDAKEIQKKRSVLVNSIFGMHPVSTEEIRRKEKLTLQNISDTQRLRTGKNDNAHAEHDVQLQKYEQLCFQKELEKLKQNSQGIKARNFSTASVLSSCEGGGGQEYLAIFVKKKDHNKKTPLDEEETKGGEQHGGEIVARSPCSSSCTSSKKNERGGLQGGIISYQKAYPWQRQMNDRKNRDIYNLKKEYERCLGHMSVDQLQSISQSRSRHL